MNEILQGIYPILNVTPSTDVDSMLDWAVELAEVGVRQVQIRAKQFTDDALPMLLDDITSTLRGTGLIVLLNDYVELVGITGADGVHLGLEDFPISQARRILGPKAIVGATCRNREQAIISLSQKASYIAAGSVYESKTKGGLPVIGLDGLRDVVNAVGHRIPVCAIGGITLERLGEIHSAGADMVAIIEAVQGNSDPVRAAGKMIEEWERLEKMKTENKPE